MILEPLFKNHILTKFFGHSVASLLGH